MQNPPTHTYSWNCNTNSFTNSADKLDISVDHYLLFDQNYKVLLMNQFTYLKYFTSITD